MKVLFYKWHNLLPFSTDPFQPTCVFDPDLMANYTNDNDKKFCDTNLWSGLLALTEINSDLIAHVSVNINNNESSWSVNRFWLEISTPATVYENGIPLIVDSTKKVTVESEGDFFTNMKVYEYDKTSLLSSDERLNFWKYYFQKMMENNKKRFIAEKRVMKIFKKT